MGPMLKQIPPPLRQSLELARPIPPPPGRKDHMMRPLDRADAVDLYEAKTADQIKKAVIRERAPNGIGQRVAREKETASG